jgi:MoaA/NifB/PqqE/SkfB family radical SAM enzyme
MQTVLSFIKDIPVLLKTYISSHILIDIHQLIVIRNKRFTGSFPIEVHVTEHCNLNCKGCNHFSCLAEEEYLATDQFEKDIKRLSQLSKKYYDIKILGGEPLLHPQITDFFRITRNYFSSTRIQITTNGILLPKQDDEFWISCRENKITVITSQYPVKLDKKTIKEKAKKHKVKVVYRGTTAQERMCKMPLDITGSQDMKKSHQKCAISWGCCVTLRDGKIYTCCFAAHIKIFNKFFNQNLMITENDYIDIYKVNNKNEIIKFLAKPFPFCRYCKTSDIKFAQKWDITKKEITEWI